MNKKIEIKELRLQRVYRLNISRELKEFLRKVKSFMCPNLYMKSVFVESLRVNDVSYICGCVSDKYIYKDKNDNEFDLKIKKLATGLKIEIKKLRKFLNSNNYFFSSGEDLIDLT